MLKCELCGSTLIKVDDNVFACEGCGCKYTKEQALKLLDIKSEASTPPPVPASNDFVIVAGVLKKYTGSAIDVEVPQDVLELDAGVFSGMTSLRSVKLPDGIKCIPSSAFYDCKSLKSVTLPDTVTCLCSTCFAGCISLEKISLPQRLKEIQTDAFSGCESLTELMIPNSVEKIGDVYNNSGVVYKSIFGFYIPAHCSANLTVRMPSRFDPRLVKGCKRLYDLSGKRMETAEEFYKNESERNYRRNNHLCLACGGEIGIFSNKCKRCGKPFGEV